MTEQPSPEPFYSMARRAGDILFLSGFGPVGDDLQVVGADIEEQTAFTMDAIGRASKKRAPPSTTWSAPTSSCST